MPRLQWRTEILPSKIITQFEQRGSEREQAGALMMWAVLSVECLHYLDDVDTNYHDDDIPSVDHEPCVISIAHARWATGTAITALDLCAAAFGRAYCNLNGPRELDLRSFDQAVDRKAAARRIVVARRNALLPAALKWVDGVFADPRYENVLRARNALTHSRLKRQFEAKPKDTKLLLEATRTRLTTRQMVCLSRDLATDQMTEFLNTVHDEL
jgi:hypothetical protein